MNKNSIVSQLNRQDIDRLRGYRERLDFYHGRQWEGRERRGEKRLTFNYAKVFIDKVTSYLMSGVNFAVEAIEDSDEAKTKARRAEAAKRRVLGLTLVYNPRRGEYHQRLLLGGV